MSQRDEYIAKMKLQLDELNAHLRQIESRAKDAREDAQEKYQQELVTLRLQSQLALAKLGTLANATEEGWDAMVAEMESVRDAFTSAFKYFKSQL